MKHYNKTRAFKAKSVTYKTYNDKITGSYPNIQMHGDYIEPKNTKYEISGTIKMNDEIAKWYKQVMEEQFQPSSYIVHPTTYNDYKTHFYINKKGKAYQYLQSEY